MTFLAVFLGGGLGACCRYLTDIFLKKYISLPLSTLTINTAGSFLLGLLIVLTSGTPLYLLLGTGFCGGFTTFSTAMVEVVREFRGRRPAWILILTLGQILLACIAAWVGMNIALTLR